MKSIQFNNADLGYGRKTVLSKVNWEFQTGQAVLLTGPNGSGKTTLARTVLGLISPLAGHYQNSFRRVGYVPQASRLDPGFPFRLWEVVLTGRLAGLGPGSFARDRESYRTACRFLEMVGVSAGAAELLYSEASGGQRQRALIARSLLGRPELIIADEPFSNLDRVGRSLVADLFEKEGREQNLSLIIIDHPGDDYHLRYDREYRVEGGRIGPRREVTGG